MSERLIKKPKHFTTESGKTFSVGQYSLKEQENLYEWLGQVIEWRKLVKQRNSEIKASGVQMSKGMHTFKVDE